MHDAVTAELIDDDVDRLVATFLPEIDDDDRRNDIRDRLTQVIQRSSEFVVPDDQPMQMNVLNGRDPLFIRFAGDLASAWLPLGPAKDIPQALEPELLRVQTDLVATTLLRSLLEELHLHRDAGLLRGDDPEERFDDFVERTRTRAGLAALRTAHPGAFATA